MKHASVLLAVGCLVSAVSAQWLETTIPLDSGSAPCALCYNSQNNRIYCANYDLGTVTVISGDSNRIIATVAVGVNPTALYYNPTDNKVYCANYSDSSVTVIDGAGDSAVATVVAGGNPLALCYNQQQNRVYCANHGSNDVTVIDGASNSVIATKAAGNGPRALCYNPTDHKVYCANNADSSVTVIDGVSDSVIATVTVRRGPRALCYNPTDDEIYCADSARFKVSVISGAGDSIVATVPTGDYPWALCYNPVGNRAYCADWGTCKVTVIDGGTNSVIATVPLLRDQPVACSYDPLNSKIYVACRGFMGSGQGVYVIDGASDDTVRAITTDYGSGCLCLNPVQNRVYVANYDSHTISVLRDSMSGIEEGPKPQSTSSRLAPSIVRGALFLPEVAGGKRTKVGAYLFDISGRKVMDLRPGVNDVRALAPAVYFVRETAGSERSALVARKVVLTE